MPLALDQRLFEYRIVSVLGWGVFGIVCLTHDAFLGRPVAIKELTILSWDKMGRWEGKCGSMSHRHSLRERV
jgi:serine/threonine protein kinase